MKRIIAVAIATISLLVLPSLALANSSSTAQGYNKQTNQALNATASRATPSTATGTTASSTLPFTGIDVGLLVTGGVVLLGSGLVMRRLSSES